MNRDRSFHLLAVLVLIAINLLVVSRYIVLQFGQHFFSIEGLFVSIAEHHLLRVTASNWVGLWLLGIPSEHIYVPLLHALVAIVRDIWNLSSVEAYHRTTGVLYCMAPLTYYVSLQMMGVGKRKAFLAAVFVSVLSPAILLSPDILRDLGGSFAGQRLRVLSVYGEGPHIAALVIVPLLLGCLSKGDADTNPFNRYSLFTYLLIPLLVGTNTPGTMGFCVFAAALLAVSTHKLRIVALLAAGSLTSLLLVPLSYWQTIVVNAPKINPQALPMLQLISVKALFLLAALLLVRESAAVKDVRARFFLLSGIFFAVIVISSRAFYFELLPQGARLHIELEFCLCYFLAEGTWNVLTGSTRTWRAVTVAVLLSVLLFGLAELRERRRMDNQQVDFTNRVEYKAAVWANKHLKPDSGRAYVSGSAGYWFNILSNVPQVGGCCEQGTLNDIGTRLRYVVDQSSTADDVARAVDWAIALGVQALILPSEQSNDAYRSTKEPGKFAAYLERAPSEPDLFAFRLPTCAAPYVHLVPRTQIVPPGTDRATLILSEPIRRFASEVRQCHDDRLRVTWRSEGNAQISAGLRKGEVISIQVNSMDGWVVSGVPQESLRSDGLGFMVIDPQCEEECTKQISLEWHGRPLTQFSRAIGALSLVAVLVTFWLANTRQKGGVSPHS